MTKGHYHWEFKATNTGEVDPVIMTVLGYQNEAHAQGAVEELIVRDRYVLIRVWECTTCAYQEAMSGWFQKLIGR